MHAVEPEWATAVHARSVHERSGFFFDIGLPLHSLGMDCSVVGNWKLWVAMLFVLMALIVSAPFVPKWLWISGSIAVVVLGLALIVWANKKRKANAAEGVGLLPALSKEPPSDLDAP